MGLFEFLKEGFYEGVKEVHTTCPQCRKFRKHSIAYKDKIYTYRCHGCGHIYKAYSK